MKLKYINYIAKFSFCAMIAMASVSCEDDDPLTAGDGDPLNENIISVDATVSTTQPTVGEDNVTPFSVSLGTSFASDATVTVRALFDNGNVSLGTAVVPAGSTTGSGTITMPSDDGRIPEGLVFENAGTLVATSILLDELEEGNAYVLNSNVLDLDVYSRTLGVAGGLNVIFDWTNPGQNDLDFYVIDEAFTAIFESSETGDRFESDLFQSAGREDGVYVFYTVIFAAADEDIDYQILATLPDGSLADLTGTIPAGAPQGDFIPLGQFEKTTDEASGTVSYVNITGI